MTIKIEAIFENSRSKLTSSSVYHLRLTYIFAEVSGTILMPINMLYVVNIGEYMRLFKPLAGV